MTVTFLITSLVIVATPGRHHRPLTARLFPSCADARRPEWCKAEDQDTALVPLPRPAA